MQWWGHAMKTNPVARADVAVTKRTCTNSRSRSMSTNRDPSLSCLLQTDIHLIELAVAAHADAIVTRNLRDMSRGELNFPSLRVSTPGQCLGVFPCPR
jgi:hypothetical protein